MKTAYPERFEYIEVYGQTGTIRRDNFVSDLRLVEVNGVAHVRAEYAPFKKGKPPQIEFVNLAYVVRWAAKGDGL